MKTCKMISIGILLGLCLAQSGCFSANPKDIEHFVKPRQADVTAGDYILQPPDEVQIYCSRAPELHLRSQQIRPDGKITFENIGEIEAAGKTPQQVADILRAKVAELYTLPNEKAIDVRIKVYKSKFYYVLGEVSRPGAKLFTGRDTVLTAVSQANPMVTGWTNRIQVIRPSVDKSSKPKIFEVKWKKMVVHGDLSKNVLLQEGDIIYVPPTVLAAIAMKIEEFVRPIGRALSPAISVQQLTTVGM